MFRFKRKGVIGTRRCEEIIDSISANPTLVNRPDSILLPKVSRCNRIRNRTDPSGCFTPIGIRVIPLISVPGVRVPLVRQTLEIRRLPAHIFFHCPRRIRYESWPGTLRLLHDTASAFLALRPANRGVNSSITTFTAFWDRRQRLIGSLRNSVQDGDATKSILMDVIGANASSTIVIVLPVVKAPPAEEDLPSAA